MEKFEDFKKNFKMDDAQQDSFQATPKSSVKLIKNTKGVQWEVKIVQGEEKLLEGLMIAAVNVHKKLVGEFGK